jgi:transcription elongation GreA/GreB family factor
MRVDCIPAGTQASRARHVDGERGIDPAVDAAAITCGLLVTAGENDDAGTRSDGAVEDVVGERAARMRGDDEIAGEDRYVLYGACVERDATGEARPFAHHCLRDLRGARGQAGVDGERARRGVIEEQHEMREQPMPTGEIDDAAAAEAPSRAASQLPRLVELLPRQAVGLADDAPDAIEQRLALEMRGGAGRQLDAARVREADHACTLPGTRAIPALALTSATAEEVERERGASESERRRGLDAHGDRGQVVVVSKAFRREDADASFELPAPSTRLSESRLTAYGARIVRERLAELEQKEGSNGSVDATLAVGRLRDLLESAEVVDPAGADHVALGARVTVQSDKSDVIRTVVIVTPDEVGLVPSGISAASPLAQVLLGATKGDTVELELPRGTEELTVLALEWPA